MQGAAHRSRIGIAAALAGTALATAVSALGAAPPLRFASAPTRAPQGGHVAVTVAVKAAGAACSLRVRYANGATQPGLAATHAVAGRASWSWNVPTDAAIGRAQLAARCAGAGSKTRSLLVVGASTPLRLEVVKDGFSVRNRSYGGADVSYGVLLQNRSTKEDALNVSVLVNFVMADDKLIGSQSQVVASIPAGTTYALGNSLGFDGAAPVVRLEVVVQVEKRQPHKLRTPALDNIHLEAGNYDEAFVGGVDGELVNDDAKLVLQNASLSAVILDAGGNVVGGGSGYAFAALPPSTREVFKITSGVAAVPMTSAAGALVSVIPTYALPT